MSDHSLEQLREELRSLGYLSRGIERWFALDPRRSRTFWVELFVVALKAALVIAPFVAAAVTFFLANRNHLGVIEVVVAATLYFAASLAALALLVIAVALVLRYRAEVAIANPRILTVLALLLTMLVVLSLGAWWFAFPALPSTAEAAVGVALLGILFFVSVSTIAAALLSFSIYETHLVPRVRRARQGALIGASVGMVILALIVPLIIRREPREIAPPEQVVFTPKNARVAFVAVDGLSSELAHARPELLGQFRTFSDTSNESQASPPEAWATIGTGTLPSTHGVHAVEGVRLAGSARVLQSISRADFVLRRIAPLIRAAQRQPLPPTARRRDYAWEILSRRGVSAVAVNWWASASDDNRALVAVSQEAIFARAAEAAKGDREKFGVAVDANAWSTVDALIARHPGVITIYLPALDILLNRLELEPSRRVALSLRLLDPLVNEVAALRRNGYEVVLVGMPGERQNASGIIASTLPLTARPRPLDLAPTLFDLFGFPASNEMPGHSLLPSSRQGRIASYGSRSAGTESTDVSPDYYENLKSLGYIR